MLIDIGTLLCVWASAIHCCVLLYISRIDKSTHIWWLLACCIWRMRSVSSLYHAYPYCRAIHMCAAISWFFFYFFFGLHFFFFCFVFRLFCAWTIVSGSLVCPCYMVLFCVVCLHKYIALFLFQSIVPSIFFINQHWCLKQHVWEQTG